MRYNHMINSCYIRVVLSSLFFKFPIRGSYNFYNKNCKLRKNSRLQNIVDFIKQCFQQIGRKKTFNQNKDAPWKGSLGPGTSFTDEAPR